MECFIGRHWIKLIFLSVVAIAYIIHCVKYLVYKFKLIAITDVKTVITVVRLNAR